MRREGSCYVRGQQTSCTSSRPEKGSDKTVKWRLIKLKRKRSIWSIRVGALLRSVGAAQAAAAASRVRYGNAREDWRNNNNNNNKDWRYIRGRGLRYLEPLCNGIYTLMAGFRSTWRTEKFFETFFFFEIVWLQGKLHPPQWKCKATSDLANGTIPEYPTPFLLNPEQKFY